MIILFDFIFNLFVGECVGDMFGELFGVDDGEFIKNPRIVFLCFGELLSNFFISFLLIILSSYPSVSTYVFSFNYQSNDVWDECIFINVSYYFLFFRIIHSYYKCEISFIFNGLLVFGLHKFIYR